MSHKCSRPESAHPNIQINLQTHFPPWFLQIDLFTPDDSSRFQILLSALAMFSRPASFLPLTSSYFLPLGLHLTTPHRREKYHRHPHSAVPNKNQRPRWHKNELPSQQTSSKPSRTAHWLINSAIYSYIEQTLIKCLLCAPCKH